MKNNTNLNIEEVSPIVQSSSDSRFSAAAHEQGYHVFLNLDPKNEGSWKKCAIPNVERGSIPYYTVLAVKPMSSGDEPYEEALHYGPLYFDLDSKPDAVPALKMSRLLLDILTGWGFPEDQIRAYLTGGKGVHLLIDPEVFGWEGHEHDAYRVDAYKTFALALDAELVKRVVESSGGDPDEVVTCLDKVVYSKKRGRMWREENIKRPNDLYKVPVTAQELRELVALDDIQAGYVALCSSPRAAPESPAARRSEGAAQKFQQVCNGVRDAAAKQKEDRLSRRERNRNFALENGHDDEFPAVIGMKRLENIVAKALHGRPTDSKGLAKLSHGEWTEVLMALQFVGCTYDIMDEAEYWAIEFSRACTKFDSDKAVIARIQGFDDFDKRVDEGKPMVTDKTIFARKTEGYKDPNPDGKGCFKHEENAVDVLNKMLGKEGVQLRTAVKEDIYSEAFNACEIAGYKELLAQVEEHLKKQQLLQAFKREVKQADLQNRGADEDETGPEKLHKFVKKNAAYVKDQHGDPRILVTEGPHKDSHALLKRKDAGQLLAQVWVGNPATGGAGKIWPSKAWQDIKGHVEAECQESKTIISVYHRYAPQFDSKLNGVAYTDLGWGYAVTKAGSLEILDESPEGVYFDRNPTDLPMPKFTPLRKGEDASEVIRKGIEKLKDYSRFRNPADLYRLITILTFPICHETGFPLVYFTGGAGSGKSTLAGGLRTFVHPSRSSAISLPAQAKDFLAAVCHDPFILFDNVPYISQEVSNQICPLLTEPKSSLVSKRALNTDGDMFEVRCGLPIWMTGIGGGVISKADLQTRVYTFEVPKVEGKVKTGKEIAESLEAISGDIYHFLMLTAAKALKVRQTYTPEHESREKIKRLADCDLWHLACCEALGISMDEAAKMLSDSGSNDARKALEAHEVLCHLYKMREPWVELTGSELEDRLKQLAIPKGEYSPPRNFPAAGKITKELELQIPTIEKAGFFIKKESIRKQSAKWTIRPPEDQLTGDFGF